ncbi:MAG: DNA-binding response regulator, partial [Anaerolineales bacterium]
MTIRLLLVDDHAVVRSGLRMLLESQPDLQII